MTLPKHQTCILFLTLLLCCSVFQTNSAASEVLPGIDILAQRNFDLLQGKRVGLITNQTGRSANGSSTIDLMATAPGVQLVALFSPEHGIRGEADVKLASGVDQRSGLPIHSLYGTSCRPTPEMLAGIELLVFDIQDIGARFYTYITTLYHIMSACARWRKTCIVLDRVNPSGGERIEGNILQPDFISGIGIWPIAMRHGLTIGEMARFFNTECGIGCDLHVVPVSGWRRSMLYADCDLAWINTSPQVPNPDAAILYNGISLIAGTPVSWGRGTTRPFEQVGAPWLDADDLAASLNDRKLPGVYFRPAYFMPTHFTGNLCAGQLCRGVHIHLTDRRVFNSVETGVRMLCEIKRRSGTQFFWRASGNSTDRYYIDFLCGSKELRESQDEEELLANWRRQSRDFAGRRAPYLLYD